MTEPRHLRPGACLGEERAGMRGGRGGDCLPDLRASTAPIVTCKFCIDAVPHTVPGTNAGSASRRMRRSSTTRLRSGTVRTGLGPAVSLSGLPQPGGHLPLLRPRPGLLQRRLLAAGAPAVPASSRPTLPGEPSRPADPCPPDGPLSRPARNSDASWFTPAAGGCFAAGRRDSGHERRRFPN